MTAVADLAGNFIPFLGSRRGLSAAALAQRDAAREPYLLDWVALDLLRTLAEDAVIALPVEAGGRVAATALAGQLAVEVAEQGQRCGVLQTPDIDSRQLVRAVARMAKGDQETVNRIRFTKTFGPGRDTADAVSASISSHRLVIVDSDSDALDAESVRVAARRATANRQCRTLVLCSGDLDPATLAERFDGVWAHTPGRGAGTFQVVKDTFSSAELPRVALAADPVTRRLKLVV